MEHTPRSQRFQFSLLSPTYVRLQGGSTTSSSTVYYPLNFSSEGMFLAGPPLLEEGAVMDFVLEQPGAEHDIEGRFNVRWTRTLHSIDGVTPSGHGVQIDKADSSKWQEYLHYLIKELEEQPVQRFVDLELVTSAGRPATAAKTVESSVTSLSPLKNFFSMMDKGKKGPFLIRSGDGLLAVVGGRKLEEVYQAHQSLQKLLKKPAAAKAR